MRRAWRGLTFVVLGCMVINATLNVTIAFTLSDDFWIGYRLVSAIVAPCTILLLSFLYLRFTNQKVEFIDPKAQPEESS